MKSPIDELKNVVDKKNNGEKLWSLFEQRIHVHPYRLPPFVADHEAEIKLASDVFNEAWNPLRPKLIYIHVPFCTSICPYCPFSKQRYNTKEVDRYFNGLIQHLTYISESIGKGKIVEGKTHTLYFGGGSPSSLKAEQLIELVQISRKLFLLNDDAEVTVELRVADIDEEYLNKIINSGEFNRLSFGVQSFSKDLRQSVGRRSDPSRVKEIVSLAIENIDAVNIDLMYGLPEQTMENWESDLKMVLDLGATACSTYRLNIHSSTSFGVQSRRGNLAPVPKSSLENEMWLLAEKLLVDELNWTPFTPANYGQYPFEKGTYNAKQLDASFDIIGFGAGAHGQIGTHCYSTPKKTSEFLLQNDGECNFNVHYLNENYMIARDLLSLSVGATVNTKSLRKDSDSAQAHDLLLAADLAKNIGTETVLTRNGMYWSRNLFYLFQQLHKKNLQSFSHTLSKSQFQAEKPESTVPIQRNPNFSKDRGDTPF